jgi:hypothetical protein
VAATVTAYRDDAYAIIVQQIGSVPTASADTAFLKNLEYRMVELMIDEEDARNHNSPRAQMIPRDYMYERDRERLNGMGSTFNRGVCY